MSTEQDKLTITPEEASKMAGVTPYAIYQGLQQGKIPAFKLGRLWRIPKKAFLKMCDGEAA